jgi:hypothetical protein
MLLLSGSRHITSTPFSLNYTGPMDVPHFGLNADDFEGAERGKGVGSYQKWRYY